MKDNAHIGNAGTYNWDADAPGRYFLYQAQEVGGDDLKITMFVNSAPAAMTLEHASCGTSFANGEWENEPSRERENSEGRRA